MREIYLHSAEIVSVHHRVQNGS